MPTPLRLAAAVVLLLQLQPFALPGFCELQRGASAGCEQPMAPAAAAKVGVAGAAQPCVSAALCGVPATAVTPALAVDLAVVDVVSNAFFSLAPLRPGDSPAPIPPPPQA